LDKPHFSDIIYAVDIIGDEKPDESIEIYREEENKESEEKSQEKNEFSLIFILLILGIVGGGVYYFKIRVSILDFKMVTGLNLTVKGR